MQECYRPCTRAAGLPLTWALASGGPGLPLMPTKPVGADNPVHVMRPGDIRLMVRVGASRRAIVMPAALGAQ
jgi:hypothetical protein